MPDFLSLSWRLTAELANRYRYRYRSCICILYVLRIRTRARMCLLSGTVTDIKAHSPAYTCSTYVCKYMCICFKCFAFDLFSSLIKNAFRNFHFVSLPPPAPRARCGSDALSDKRNMLIKSKNRIKSNTQLPRQTVLSFSGTLLPPGNPSTNLESNSRKQNNFLMYVDLIKFTIHISTNTYTHADSRGEHKEERRERWEKEREMECDREREEHWEPQANQKA